MWIECIYIPKQSTSVLHQGPHKGFVPQLIVNDDLVIPAKDWGTATFRSDQRFCWQKTTVKEKSQGAIPSLSSRGACPGATPCFSRKCWGRRSGGLWGLLWGGITHHLLPARRWMIGDAQMRYSVEVTSLAFPTTFSDLAQQPWANKGFALD